MPTGIPNKPTSWLDKLTKEAPAGRGANALTTTEIKDITKARRMGYSWDQIAEKHGVYGSGGALSTVYYKITEAHGKNGKTIK